MATKSDVSMSTCIDSYGSAIGMPQFVLIGQVIRYSG